MFTVWLLYSLCISCNLFLLLLNVLKLVLTLVKCSTHVIKLALLHERRSIATCKCYSFKKKDNIIITPFFSHLKFLYIIILTSLHCESQQAVGTMCLCFLFSTAVIILERKFCTCVTVTQNVLFVFSAGVVGSVIHYPHGFGEVAQEVESNGYRTL